MQISARSVLMQFEPERATPAAVGVARLGGGQWGLAGECFRRGGRNRQPGRVCPCERISMKSTSESLISWSAILRVNTRYKHNACAPFIFNLPQAAVGRCSAGFRLLRLGRDSRCLRLGGWEIVRGSFQERDRRSWVGGRWGLGRRR